MGLIEIVMIAVGLAMDAFAVSLGVGTAGMAATRRATFRLSFHFGLFQALMPIVGWFLGMWVEGFISAVDHWLAFGLLAFVAARMIRSGLSPDEQRYNSDPTRGLSLVMLSVATSIDALAVGLSLGMLHVQIWYPSVIIGLITGGLSLLGTRMGNRLGARFGSRMEILGGLILLFIGVRIVVAHVLGA